jgi:GGDEF domain-containing protein
LFTTHAKKPKVTLQGLSTYAMPTHRYVQRQTLRAALAAGLALWLWLLGMTAMAASTLELPPNFGERTGTAKTTQKIQLHQHWEAAVLPAPGPRVDESSNPDAVWAKPADVFVTRSSDSVWLQPDERYVTRLSLTSSRAGGSLHLHGRASRTDAVHIAYRWNKGPWVQAKAGDTIAMQHWPVPSVSPSFLLEQQVGQLDLIVEFAHSGAVDTHINLVDPRGGHTDGLSTLLFVGLLAGICLVIAISGVVAAGSFRRLSFLTATLLSLSALSAVALHSGVLPIYVATGSARFSDESKVIVNTLWCALMPFAVAVLLSTRRHAPAVWWASVLWFLALVSLSFWVKSNELRWLALPIGLVQVALSVAFCLGLALLAYIRNQTPQPLAWVSLAMLVASLLLPLVTYLGLQGSGDIFLWSASGLIAGTVTLFQAMVQQHRQGRMVLARAKFSALRDALTGLLNRAGFEKRLDRELQFALGSPQGGCAFLFLQLDQDLQTLHQKHGLEGVETGMVQVSAALASSFSAVDALGRIGSHTFAIAIPDCTSVQQAHTQAQRLLTQLMKLAAQAAPIANDARVAVAWLGSQAVSLAELERSCKRIAQLDALAVSAAAKEVPMAEAISELRKEMLGPETQAETAFAPTSIEEDSPLGNKPRPHSATANAPMNRTPRP